MATRTPTVSVDEPEYCDPAANLYLGSGFTSTMWGQNRDEFWSGNVPLYQGMLFCFFKIFGFGLFQARVVNTFLAAAGALLTWGGLRRSALIRQPVNRLICLALVLSGSVTTLTFRTIRPDTTMFFVCALVFFAWSLRSGWGRYALVALGSALLPVAGIPMIPYAGLMLLIGLAVYRFAAAGLFVSVAGGLLAGIAGLAVFYRHFSALQTFVEIVLPFTGIGGAHHGGASFLRSKLFGEAFGEESLITSFFGNPTRFLDQRTMFDYSAALLFAAAIILSVNAWRLADSGNRRFMVFIFALTLVVPPIMHLAGHYRSMYRWMTFIPLCVAAPRMLEMQLAGGKSILARRLALAGMGVSVLLGLPLRSLAALPGWSGRSTGPIERVAAGMARPTDVVVCDFKVYFALRPRVKLLYAHGLPARGEFDQTKDLPANEVTLLCLFPKDVEAVKRRVGGKWKKLPLEGTPGAAELGKTRYAVDFYRRETEPGDTRVQ